MTIDQVRNNSELLLIISGRIDTSTAPGFEKAINDNIENITSLILDFRDVSYISSAGLRVLLSAQKVMNIQGRMKLLHVNDTVMQIFEVTGFSYLLTIE